MILNSTLNSIAQAYANKLAALDIFEHSGSGYGENLYYSGSSQAIDINSINGISFIKDYNFCYYFFNINSMNMFNAS